MPNYLLKAKNSFLDASKGEEIFFNIIWFWGALSYFIVFLVIEKLIIFIDISLISFVISFIVSLYFAWHIYVTHKCKPRNRKLTKEEKKLEKQKRRQQTLKTLLQKILLQKSWTKWNSASVLTAIDLYIIAHFFHYIFK